MKAKINDSGAILLGNYFVCDAHADRPVRVVTHAHIDHIEGLGQSIQSCEEVIMTPLTKELITILYGFRYGSLEKVRCLEYGDRFNYREEKITLFDAGHIFGSAQVLVEDQEDARIVYTGDFKLPESKIIPSDILVMEATYGNPSCARPFRDQIEEELVKLVKESLKLGPVYVFGYHGKLQETTKILREGGIAEPILLPGRVYEVAKACERYGIRLGDYMSLRSPEAKEIVEKGNYVCICHMRSGLEVKEGATKVRLSGWEFRRPWRKVGEREYVVALSDHSDFEQLIEYVRESNPKLVITDNYRVGDAVALAREIRRKLKIPAWAMP